jgi:hypothetical protein
MIDFSKNRIATIADIEQLLTAISSENFFVDCTTYRKILGIGKTQFSYLKKIGRFDLGTHKATLGSRRIRIHRYFCPSAQKIIWFPEKVTPLKKRGKNKATGKPASVEVSKPKTINSLIKAGGNNMEKSIKIKPQEALQQQKLLNQKPFNSLTKAGGKNDEAV